ncbi:MAG: cupin domain-containing protein [Dehalococcoidia bacterium]|nr:cupin domain-containing protein [Dehalococcoidia bacterium]
MERKETYATQEEYDRHVIHYQDVPIVEVAPSMKYHIVSGERITVGFINAAPNAVGPTHKHEAEQILIVMDGACEEAVEGKLFPLKKGDVLVIPSNVEHGTYMSDKGCQILDIYSPPRQDYLAKLEEVKKSQKK